MHALGFACGPQTVLGVLPDIYLGRPFRRDGILEALPHRVVIEHDAPIGLMMDGDFIPGTQRLEIECGPRVRFLVP